MNSKEKGITMIALIITIVVLLIITGVSISSLVSEDGVINKATNSKAEKDKSEEKEAVEWAAAQLIGEEDNKAGIIGQNSEDKEKLSQKLKEYIGKKSNQGKQFEFSVLGKGETYSTDLEEVITDGLIIVKFTNSENRYLVDQNGNVYSEEDLNSVIENIDGVKILPTEKIINNEEDFYFQVFTNARIKSVSCDNENIAELKRNSNGKVELTDDGKFYMTSKSIGKTKVKVVTEKGKNATAYITVYQDPKAIELNYQEQVFDLTEGPTTVQLETTILPQTSNHNTGITWSSDNEAVATVDSKGFVTGISNGEAVITVKTENEKTATCKITVGTSPVAISLDKDNAFLDTTGINKSKNVQLNVSYDPITSTFNRDLTWTSSNDRIASVDSNGNVTAVSNGQAVITAKTANGKEASCVIYVETSIQNITLSQNSVNIRQREISGKTVKLTESHTPNSATEKIYWTSSNNDIATVDNNGLVTIKNKGRVTITAQSSSNNAKASCTINIVKLYTLTFDPNGGSVTPTSYELGEGETYTLPTATKDGVTFIGWNYNNETGYEAGSTYTMPANDITLKAEYKSDSSSGGGGGGGGGGC